MDLDLLRDLYNACNPDEPLSPTDARNVDLDALGMADERVRGANWVSRLARQVELSRGTPICKYFTGLRGSGKSTELRRLAVRLSRPSPGAQLLPVLIDAEETLDLTSEIDIADIMAAILYGTERHVLWAEGRNPNDALQDGYGKRFWNWLNRTDVTLSSVEVGVEAQVVEGKIVTEMRTRPTLRQRIRGIITANLTSFLGEVRSELTALENRAKARNYSGLIVIFDSLEKLQGASTNWNSVLQSAERVFASDAPYLQLPVHVLYTIPPALVLRLKVDVHYLPMIKLYDRAGKRFEPGFRAAREIVRQRIPDVYVREIFGSTSGEARLTKLIEWSGGYPREIIRLLQQVMEIEEEPITQKGFETVLARAGDAYRRVVLASGAIDWLASVAVDRSLIFNTHEQQQAADRMLSNNVVLRYLNETEWFDVHPAVRDLEPLQTAIDRLKQARERVAT